MQQRDNNVSIKPLSTTIPQPLGAGKDGVFEGWCLKERVPSMYRNSFFLTIKKHCQILCCGGVFQKHLCL